MTCDEMSHVTEVARTVALRPHRGHYHRLSFLLLFGRELRNGHTEFLRAAPGQREHLRADIETRDAPARSDKSGGSKSHWAGTGAEVERPLAWFQPCAGDDLFDHRIEAPIDFALVNLRHPIPNLGLPGEPRSVAVRFYTHLLFLPF